MYVFELIEFLQAQPQELKVSFKLYSEQKLLTIEDISIEEHCEPRADGWIQNRREDKPFQSYLMFSGN